MATPDPHAAPSTTPGAGETHATTEAEHGSGGLPQLQMQHWAGQIAWLLILFAIGYVLMSRVFIPRLRKVLDEREGTIAGALEQARKVQEEANAQAAQAQTDLADARAKAHKLASDARAKAAAEAQARQAAEDAKLAEKMAEAETRIRASRDAAMSHVSTIASDTASAIVEKLTGSAPKAADLTAALNAAKQGVA
jgi:F-type H+-transporting ATPase subunit b